MAEFCVDVVYKDNGAYPKLPGMEDVEVIELVEIDESIVLNGSTAETGVRIDQPGRVLECEIFMPTLPRERWIEIYPLDGKNEPITVNYEIGNCYILEDEVLKNVVWSALAEADRLKAA